MMLGSCTCHKLGLSKRSRTPTTKLCLCSIFLKGDQSTQFLWVFVAVVLIYNVRSYFVGKILKISYRRLKWRLINTAEHRNV